MPFSTLDMSKYLMWNVFFFLADNQTVNINADKSRCKNCKGTCICSCVSIKQLLMPLLETSDSEISSHFSPSGTSQSKGSHLDTQIMSPSSLILTHSHTNTEAHIFPIYWDSRKSIGNQKSRTLLHGIQWGQDVGFTVTQCCTHSSLHVLFPQHNISACICIKGWRLSEAIKSSVIEICIINRSRLIQIYII